MNCPLKRVETTDLLLEYSARRLDASRAAALGRHVEACAECSAFLAGQRAVWDALDEWEAPPVSMDFNRRLWQRIDRRNCPGIAAYLRPSGRQTGSRYFRWLQPCW